jgi:enoyl-CoA hydratase
MAGITDVLLRDDRDRVAVLTLNRPDRRNALDRTLRRALRQAVADAEADDAVDVVVLTGADPAFCAGLDLTEFATADSGLADEVAAVGAAGGGPLGPHRKPVIGAVNGVAVTGGLELALGCDFLVASDRARFADTHARVGVQPGWGMSVLLPEAVGVRRAREMSLTGNFVDAPTALAWGLVNYVVPHGELVACCLALAAAVVSNDQRGIRQLLDTYDRGMATTRAEAWTIEAEVHRTWTKAQMARRGTADGTASSEELRRVIERGRAQVEPGS